MVAATFGSNAPDDYVCPICLGLQGADDERTLMKITDVVYKDDLVTVFINSFFVGSNEGHAIIVPNEHFENIYSIPELVGHRISEVTQKVAIAIKKLYVADGITIRQNNEPAGDQHAFHFHQHVFPRYADDGYNAIQPSNKRLAEPTVRAEYAKKLRAEMAQEAYLQK